MFGAVLWSAASSERAVIWCEDHADLAFFAAECSCKPQLEAGDLVSFTITEQRSLRVAQDVEVVAAEEYPFLANGLSHAREAKRVSSHFVKDCSVKSNVVPFVVPNTPSALPICANVEKTTCSTSSTR